MIYDKRSTFVKRDVEILSASYKVKELHFNATPKFKTPLAFLVQFFYLLSKGFFIDKVICQSAGYLSFLPSLLSKFMPFTCYIIAIGTDSAKLPEINYGHFTKPLLAWFARVSFKSAHVILPVHKSLHQCDYSYDDIAFKKQGFGNFIPKLKTPIIEVVNGYKHKLFELNIPFTERPKDFLTVAVKLNRAAYYRKGLDLILKAALKLPAKTFTVVSEFEPLDEIPPNVTIVKTVTQKKLVSMYNNHKFYLQLSMFEGFPNALCEAMLCGCIPIGSRVAAIPEIIADTGFILENKNQDQLDSLLRTAAGNNHDSTKPRNRILDNFPIERRAKELTEAISK